MKKTMMILATLLAAGNQTMAQVVQENEAAVVYYMPKTELCITLNYDIVEQEPGIFYQYAERYLGTKDVILEASTTYLLNHVTMACKTSADTQRAYKVTYQKGINNQLLTLSEDGRLLGFNTEYCAETYNTDSHLSQTNTTMHTTDFPVQVMPLLEEQFMAGSIAKMAEGTAKMIYNIRETRLNILAGDVDHTPADGVAMQLVLDELNKREKMLTELFVGSCQIHHHTQTIYYTPSNDVNQHVLARMSKFSGIVAADDLSGEPIRISVKGQRQAFETTDEVLLLDTAKPSKSKSSKTLVPSQIYYNMPGSAQITLEYGKHVFSEMTLPIAQYGVAVPLAKNLVNTKQLPQIYFNTTTGNILSIQK